MLECTLAITVPCGLQSCSGAFLQTPRAARARMLRVDRIAPGATPFDPAVLGAEPGRPYRGVLASPLSRYRQGAGGR